MDKEQLLYRYFSNELTYEQEQEFKELLESDSEFKKQFDFEKGLQNVIRDTETINLKSKLIDFEKDLEREVPVHKIRPSYRKWAMAASVALLMTLGWLGYTNFSGPRYGQLYDSNFQEYPNTVFTITRGESVESVERDAFAAYESGAYEQAISAFHEIPLNDREQYIDFYIGQSYLNLNQMNQAKLSLEKVTLSQSNLAGEAHWYLALIAIKEENKAKAVEQLNLLVADYDYNKDKASELLKELE